MGRVAPHDPASVAAKFFDTVLDRTVAPGYSRLGYALRAAPAG